MVEIYSSRILLDCNSRTCPNCILRWPIWCILCSGLRMRFGVYRRSSNPTPSTTHGKWTNVSYTEGNVSILCSKGVHYGCHHDSPNRLGIPYRLRDGAADPVRFALFEIEPTLQGATIHRMVNLCHLTFNLLILLTTLQS